MSGNRHPAGAASLADEAWRQCSVHEVVLGFLRAEWEKWPAFTMFGDRRIIDEADLSEATQNNLRFLLLWSVRSPLLQFIPADTLWYRVIHLRGQHFGQLRAINFPEWNAATDTNELDKVATRRLFDLRGPVSEWEPPILWGHDTAGPFTVLEGNHRMTALAGCAAERETCALTVYVGLSRKLCRWHYPDRLALIAQGWPATAL